ncbi:MAG: MTH938/NDUFAF3 family protein [Gammaproteobacteria bacterium]|nr:MTH938/NDUFAF3 family protein [Gammaproteobacteria bacterium]
MKFSLEATNANQIHFYDDNQIIINPDKRSYLIQQANSLIITPEQVITNFRVDDFTHLTDDDIAYLQELEPEVIIFATGSSPHNTLSITALKLAEKAIGVESMALGAACRTYNLLVLEGRRAILVVS